MIRELLDITSICTVCGHHPLIERIILQEGDKIIEANLECSVCSHQYEIRKGDFDHVPNVPLDPPCLFCGEPIEDREFAKLQYKWWGSSRTEEGRYEAHCFDEYWASVKNSWKYKLPRGRPQNEAISRLAYEAGISRGAARQRLNRLKKRITENAAGTVGYCPDCGVKFWTCALSAEQGSERNSTPTI